METLKGDYAVMSLEELSPSLQEEGIKLLAKEFKGSNTEEQAHNKFKDNIECGKEKVKVVVLEGRIAGIGTYKIYGDSIRDQLYIREGINQSGEQLLSLARFGNLVDQISATEFVPNPERRYYELAYNVVIPEFRGKGIGGSLFRSRLSEIKRKAKDDEFIFTIARSSAASPDEAAEVVKKLLENETTTNGRDEVQKTIVTGIWVSATKLGLGENSFINPSAGADATVKLATKYKLMHLGYSKKLSPLYIIPAKEVVTI
jgi:GNAT superfamily N-acetyltransferase